MRLSGPVRIQVGFSEAGGIFCVHAVVSRLIRRLLMNECGRSPAAAALHEEACIATASDGRRPGPSPVHASSVILVEGSAMSPPLWSIRSCPSAPEL